MAYDDADLPDHLPDGGLPLRGTRYVLLRLLGRGGQGRAYLALDPNLDREVVIKIVYAPDSRSRAQFAERMKREAVAMTKVDHPAVTKLHTTEVLPSGNPCLVLEYVRGMTLSQRIRRDGPLPLRDALRIAGDIADGLGAVHAVQFVHRDIKPSNVMVTEQGRAKIIDFGIAKKVSEESAKDGHNTTQGQLVGTPGYTSPELAYAQVPSPASDLYSVGCILYEMLTGRPPFSGADLMEVLSHHIHTPPPTLSAAGFQSPWLVELEGLVARLLQKDPRDRPQSAAELRRLIGSIEQRLPADVQIATGEDASSEAPTMSIAYDAITRQDPRRVSFSPASTVTRSHQKNEVPTVSAGGDLGTTASASPGSTAAAVAPAPSVAIATTPLVAERRRSGGVWVVVAALLAAALGVGGTYLAFVRTKGAPSAASATPLSTATSVPTPLASTTAIPSTVTTPPSEGPSTKTSEPKSSSAPPVAKGYAGPSQSSSTKPAAISPSVAPVAPGATPPPTPTSPAPTTTGKPAIDDRT